MFPSLLQAVLYKKISVCTVLDNVYCSSIEFVPEPEPYHTLIKFFKDSKFSNTTRQKFMVNIFSNRVNSVLSESFLTLKICRVVLENFDLEN